MSENKKSYPNAFLFGFASGATLNMFTRFATMEPLAARPFSYLRLGLFFGVTISYYDWWKRCALQEVLIESERTDYWVKLRAVNYNARLGEEDEMGNLTEYLAGNTTRM